MRIHYSFLNSIVSPATVRGALRDGTGDSGNNNGMRKYSIRAAHAATS